MFLFVLFFVINKNGFTLSNLQLWSFISLFALNEHTDIRQLYAVYVLTKLYTETVGNNTFCRI